MVLRLFAVAVFGWTSVVCAQRARGPVTVQVLAINDFHANLEPPQGKVGMVNGVPAGGAEYLATDLKAAEKENRRSIVVGAGDLMGASPFLSGSQKDLPTVESMNAMGMSVSSLGNHELDHGVPELERRLKTAKYQYLAANMLRDGKTVLAATTVRVVGGVKIGFIGEVLEGVSTMVQPKGIEGLSFTEESEAANKAAERLERQGVHAIVLLIHQGGRQKRGEQGGEPTPIDPNACEDFSGPIVGIAEKLSPAIKVVVSGHTHEFYNCTIAGHTVTSAGSYGRLFTRINLTIDPKTDTVLNVAAKNVVVTRDVAKDPVQTAILKKYKPMAEKITQQVVGELAGPLSKKPNDAGESAMGDLIADAQLWATKDKEQGGAQIALMNPGGIREDLMKDPNGEGKYVVTYGDLAATQPFGNRLMVITLTGAQLRAVLEQQFKGSHVGKLQVSEGFTYEYKKDAPEGEHVVSGSMKLNGRVIDDSDVLQVEASDFLLNGGDGFTQLKEGRDPVTGPLDLDALVGYVKGHSPVKESDTGRIVRVD
jgi:5'-nucleotidase